MTVLSTNNPLEVSLQVMDVVEGTTVDGPGLRTSIYLAGCRHKCPGCHNPQTWSFSAGRPMSIGKLLEIITEAEFPVTLTGGDPLYQAPQVAMLAKEIKQRLGLNIWLYTGFTIEQIRSDAQLSLPLLWIDTIVDGPFIEAEKDISLLFRGSRNQRIISKEEF